MTGPHKRRSRRRRLLKVLVISAAVLMLLLASTWMTWTPPEQAAGPSIQELVTAQNLYEISGDRGWAHEYLEKWPEHAAYIRGEADSIEACE